MQSWYKRLFETEITEEYKVILIKDLKEEFQNFYQEYDDNPNKEIKDKLNQWYFSSEGQEELLRFTKDFWELLNSQSLYAMPAHDARHALYKVPTYSLKYIISENVQGWEKIGLIGALGHDFGRWAEEHIYGNAQDGTTHSRMSYVLIKEFLKEYDFPIEIKKMILNSVIKHTTGANEQESMPIKLTVSPDRDQLVGPEMILRIFHHKPKEDALRVFFDEPSQKSVIAAIVRMYFSRLPGPLFSLEHELRKSFKITLTFCLMNIGLEKLLEYKNNLTKGFFSEEMFREDLNYAKQEIEKIMKDNSQTKAEDCLLTLLSANNLCPEKSYKELAVKKIEQLTEKEKQILAKSLNWVNQQRILLDNEQYQFLVQFNQQIEEKWLKWISHTLISNW